jgi:hypothetical protein
LQERQRGSKAMAGATSEAFDPVEIAKQDIGSSRRLIAASLDDLSAHHSWLETYHRDERLRAERLRRREILQRLELAYRRTRNKAQLAARTSYVTSRRASRSAKRLTLAMVAWAAPRLRTHTQHAAISTVDAWRWSQDHIPRLAHSATRTARDSFCWSVRASEEAGYVFRRHASAATAEVTSELRRRIAPIRERGASEWSRIRTQTRSTCALLEPRLLEPVTGSNELAWIRRSLRRSYIRVLTIFAPLAMQTRVTAAQIETRLATLIIRTAPAFRQLLLAHMPRDRTPANSASESKSGALILRPTTALTCIVPARSQLPVLYGT